MRAGRRAGGAGSSAVGLAGLPRRGQKGSVQPRAALPPGDGLCLRVVVDFFIVK